MELSELQNVWLENNRKLEETLQINRVMLNQLLRVKPERRMVHIKTEALFTLILPLVLLVLLATGVLNLDLNAGKGISFYIGIVLFGTGYLTNYILTVKYYQLLLRVDFSQNIIGIKTCILKAEAFKLKLTRISYIMMPFGIAGIFMLMGMPIFSMKLNLPILSYLPLLLIVLVFVGSLLVTFKYRLVQRFKKLKAEIAELEKLMNDTD